MKRQPKVDISPPTSTPSTAEGMENELINLTYALLKQRLLDGTASPGETTALVKLGTAKARLDLKKTEKELELMQAKKEALEQSKHIEELYSNAIRAMREYSMFGPDEETYEEY